MWFGVFLCKIKQPKDKNTKVLKNRFRSFTIYSWLMVCKNKMRNSYIICKTCFLHFSVLFDWQSVDMMTLDPSLIRPRGYVYDRLTQSILKSHKSYEYMIKDTSRIVCWKICGKSTQVEFAHQSKIPIVMGDKCTTWINVATISSSSPLDSIQKSNTPGWGSTLVMTIDYMW